MADTEQRPETGKSTNNVQICVKVLKFTFSVAGLFILNIGYMVLGAVLFEYLEKHNEKLSCFSGAENYNRTEAAALTLMVDVSTKIRDGIMQDTQLPINGQILVEEDYRKILRAFSANVLSVGHNVSKNCSELGEEGGPQYSWSFASALTFALTIVTTIGYGHISPKTLWGKWVTIPYGTIGIPLMLAFLANLGGIMADMFRYIYAVVCCCGCCRKKTEKDSEEVKKIETWKTDPDGRPIGPDEEQEDEVDEDEEYNAITVPLTITLIVMFVFIVFGAGLFGVWENWGFLDACYFCFITFTTIGFGDMVPGTTNLDSPESKTQLAITGLYQAIAIAVLSMCLQMMVDELMAKFNWLGEKLGVIKKRDNLSKEEVGDENDETE